MRLYLSSYLLGDHPEEPVDLLVNAEPRHAVRVEQDPHVVLRVVFGALGHPA